MQELSLNLMREYHAQLSLAAVPAQRRSHYVRWLKLYLKACGAKALSPTDAAQSQAFIAGLAASYAEWQIAQARHALSLAFASQTRPDEAPEPADTELDAEAQLAGIAVRIKHRQQRSVEDLIAIGQDLLQAKAILPHGEFTPWIRAEFEMSYPSANRMIHVARAFADKVLTVRTLSKKALYELAAPDTPQILRSDALSRLAAGEQISWQEIRNLKRSHALGTQQGRNRDLIQLNRDFTRWAERARNWLANTEACNTDAQELTALLLSLRRLENRLEARLAEASSSGSQAA